jgi:cobalt-zinc-cadmium efflux system membrane fusion protein
MGPLSSPNVKRVVVLALLLGVGGVVLVSSPLLKGVQKRDIVSEAPRRETSSTPTLIILKPETLANAGVEVTPVVLGEFRLYREFPATVQANENKLAEVTTLIRGRVEEVYVDVGQDVERGAFLALFHSTDVGLSQAAYLKAAAQSHEASLAYERALDLYEHQVVSLAELKRREAAMRTAQADLQETKRRLELLGVSDEEIRRLDRERTVRSEVPIRAPITGRIIMRNLTRGEVVETGRTIFVVADLSDVWVVGSVAEKDVQFVHAVHSVEVRTTAYPGVSFPGTITYVGDVLDPATRTMRLRITVPNPKKLLKPEMFATVRVYAEPEPRTLTVPLSAVQRSGGSAYVFVQREAGQFEKRPVSLGQEIDQVVKVLDGLREGELVVTAGVFVLKSEFERSQIEPAK